MANKKITFILIAGAWHTGEIFSDMVQRLKEHGHDAVSIEKPSSTRRSSPYAMFEDDNAVVVNEISKACTAGNDVIMVMHSAGGMVGCTACKGFEKPSGPDHGSVIGLVFLTAHCAEDGESPLQCAQKAGVPPADWVKMDFESGYCSVDDVNDLPLEENAFYNDLSTAEAQFWGQKLQHQSLHSFTYENTWAAWKRIPGFYLITTEDKALGVPAQEYWASLPDAQWKMVERIAAGHSPMLSKPTETLDFILRSAAEAQRLK